MYRTAIVLLLVGFATTALCAPTKNDLHDEKIQSLNDFKLPVCMTFVHKCLNACYAEENTQACSCVQKTEGSVDLKKSKCVCREDPKEYRRKLKL
uniref:Uncharacterized protein n=1 Tax=Plectus sambesii TaxID=2011161 RepID=A0A914V2S7_9BILA